MRLADLLRGAGLDVQVSDSDAALDISGLTVDSREVQPGALFAALPGRRDHGAHFAAAAIGSGAPAVLTDAEGARLLGGTSVTLVVVENPRRWVAQLASTLWDAPSTNMTMIGVTGTNGKTTVTHLVQGVLNRTGRRCGVIGTLGAWLPGLRDVPLARTTPEAPALQSILANWRDAGASAVAMEVSSIALREHRVDGIVFDVSAFTGLSQDHLDYHGTMQSYFDAKADLFSHSRSQRGVAVIDDSWGRLLVSQASIPMVSVSATGGSADWVASRVADRVTIEGPVRAHLRIPVPTDFAVANLVTTVAICHELGVDAQVAADAAVHVRVPGRMEVVAVTEGIDFIVDYAHTPDAIQQVVASAASISRTRNGRVIVVIGAGGDRDPSKRMAMGRAATSPSGLVVVTDDNPRSEDPADIRAALLEGVEQAECRSSEVADRSQAIRTAVELARPGDIVLVLGKGHETTQEFADHVLALDDRQLLASFVRDRFGVGEEGERA